MPWKNGTLPKFRKFLPALVTDNPYISKHYIDNLKKLDEVSKQRLLYGNWEYDDDPAKLIEYKAIVDLWTNKIDVKGAEKYLSCDVARFGKDFTVIVYWEGLRVEKVWYYPKTGIDEVVDLLEEKRTTYAIQRSHVVIDEDGVGGGVVDNLKNVVGFVNNSRAIENLNERNKKNYANLKTQCYFLLADKINRGEIQIKETDQVFKEMLIQDLEQIKQKDIDKDEQKLRLVSKDMIKENIGRSPDFSDALMMRMFFELKSKIAFGFA